MNAPAVSNPELTAFFSRLRVCDPIPVGEIMLVPVVLQNGAHGPEADLLEESIAEGRTQVTEVNEGGAVGFVRVTHVGLRRLLLVDGEQIVGAKQNRVVNASFLIPPGATVDVPVSCVERGRWQYSGPGFKSSGTTLTSVARASKLSRVTMSALSGRGYDADQGAVWRDVDDYLSRTQVRSATGAFADAYKARAEEVEAQLADLKPLPGQVGLGAVCGERIASIDVFGSPDLYARGWRKAARGMLAEVYAKQETRAAATELVRATIGEISTAQAARRPGPGCGETLHGTVPGAVFGAIVEGGLVYHALVAGQGRS